MSISKQRLQPFILPVILAVSAVLRLWNLGQRDFWYDEAFTGVVIRAPLGEMMHMVSRDIHPPLYYVLAKFFSAVSDYNVSGIRLYSVLLGILGVWSVYLLARELFGRKAGLFSAGIIAIAPFAIQYSQEARMYTQYAFLIVLSVYFLVRACRTEKIKYTIAWGCFFGLAILTHYMSFLFVPVFIIMALLLRSARQTVSLAGLKRRSIFKKYFSASNMAVGLAIAIAFFLPWIPQAIDQFHRTESSGLGWVPQVRPVDTMYTVQTFFFGAPPGNLSQGVGTPTNQLHSLSNMYVAGIVTLLTIGAVFFLLWRSRRGGIIVALLSIGIVILLYIFSLMGHKYYVVRYLLPAAYCVYVIFGSWLARIRLRFALISVAVYIVGIVAIVHPAIPHGWNDLKNDLPKYDQDTFYVLGPIDYVIAKYYLPPDRLVLFNADQPQDRPTGWAAIGDSLRSTEQADELSGRQHTLTVSYIHLDQEASRPATLKNQQFQLVRSYDSLMLFR